MTSSPPPEISHREFVERALVAAGEWSRFADPKLLGVLVLLGLGAKDLIDHGGRSLHPHEAAHARCHLIINAAGHSCAGLVATAGYVAAAALAGLTVLFLTHGLFSRLRMRGLLFGERAASPIHSLFYFGEIARHGSQEAYRVALKSKTEQQLFDDMAGQIYEVSKVAAEKHRSAQRAYMAVMAFLIVWAAARLALSMTS
jgi:hypothetical protein